MFQFVESIRIEAPSGAVWKYLCDVEGWWPESNPDHIRLEVTGSGPEIGRGAEVVFEEKIAGVTGKAAGKITEWIEGRKIAWEGVAEYRYLGFPIRVLEGVRWRVTPTGHETQLSAHVWAKFPSRLSGWIFEWYATSFLNVIERDREHARRELEYLKSQIETSSVAAKAR